MPKLIAICLVLLPATVSAADKPTTETRLRKIFERADADYGKIVKLETSAQRDAASTKSIKAWQDAYDGEHFDFQLAIQDGQAKSTSVRAGKTHALDEYAITVDEPAELAGINGAHANTDFSLRLTAGEADQTKPADVLQVSGTVKVMVARVNGGRALSSRVYNTRQQIRAQPNSLTIQYSLGPREDAEQLILYIAKPTITIKHTKP
jgi:hypothetical protein